MKKMTDANPMKHHNKAQQMVSLKHFRRMSSKLTLKISSYTVSQLMHFSATVQMCMPYVQ